MNIVDSLTLWEILMCRYKSCKDNGKTIALWKSDCL